MSVLFYKEIDLRTLNRLIQQPVRNLQYFNHRFKSKSNESWYILCSIWSIKNIYFSIPNIEMCAQKWVFRILTLVSVKENLSKYDSIKNLTIKIVEYTLVFNLSLTS